MEYENNLILVEKPADKVALITLNNPPLNLVTLELSRELKETLFRLEQDDEVRVVVLTGSGEKAFCVGSDVKEFPLVWDDVIGKSCRRRMKYSMQLNFWISRLSLPWKEMYAAAATRWQWPAT